LSRHLVAIGLCAVAIASAIGLGDRAWRWNDELGLASPLAAVAPRIDDPHTPRLARRVVLVIIDGLGADEAHLALLDELRRRGASAVARVPYPTISRPNYVTILTGVPPRDSGVRANRVRAPVALDTVMDRARAAGLRVATASDFGTIATLFLRGTPSLDGVRLVEDGGRVAPPAPIEWPFDDARRTASLDALGAAIAELAASDAALVAVLVLDVDRAGHAAGVGAEYRGAAAAVDRTLRGALAQVDLDRDAVIVTADHGHVARGGHGGPEREVSRVPLVLAGAGVVPGAVARDPQLIDVAPTVAALLGIPAPGHAEGRALVELLALDAAAAARRAAADDARSRAVAGAVAAAHADLARPDPVSLAVALAGLVLAAVAARWLARGGALAVPVPGLAAAGVAPAVLAAATVVATGGRMSPSYVPSLTAVEQLGAVAVAVAIAAQVIASGCVVRRARDRLAAASGLALVGLGLALGATGAVRAWFSQPHLDVPPPFWMVAIPALDLAAAAGAAASAITLAIALLRRR
jgi:type I phosphodiesterase/nucleotide pyrophosphatase